MRAIEHEEREHLTHCEERIRHALDDIDERVDEYSREIQARKEYLWEARRDMDHIEKIACARPSSRRWTRPRC